jgi:BASS family bile acid:Na+ symporter
MEVGNPVTQVVLPVAAALTLFAIGLGLTVDDLRRVLLRPRAFALGVFAHVVLLPAVAFAVALALDVRPTVAVGLAVIAASPANAASNILTLLAGGDTMLSICLTALTSLGAAVTIPVVVNLALATFLPGSAEVALPVLPAALALFLISTVPVLAGMLTRRRFPGFARAVEARLTTILLVVIVVLVTAVTVTEWKNVGPALAEAGLAALLLNLGAVSLAWTAASLARVAWPQRVAIGLECGIQNFGLAAFVTLTMMGDARFLVAGIAYGLVMWISAALVVWVARRRASSAGAST